MPVTILLFLLRNLRHRGDWLTAYALQPMTGVLGLNAQVFSGSFLCSLPKPQLPSGWRCWPCRQDVLCNSTSCSRRWGPLHSHLSPFLRTCSLTFWLWGALEVVISQSLSSPGPLNMLFLWEVTFYASVAFRLQRCTEDWAVNRSQSSCSWEAFSSIRDSKEILSCQIVMIPLG